MFVSILLCPNLKTGQMDIGNRRHFNTTQRSTVQKSALSREINPWKEALLRRCFWLLKAVGLHQYSPAAPSLSSSSAWLQHPAVLQSASARRVACIALGDSLSPSPLHRVWQDSCMPSPKGLWFNCLSENWGNDYSGALSQDLCKTYQLRVLPSSSSQN